MKKLADYGIDDHPARRPRTRADQLDRRGARRLRRVRRPARRGHVRGETGEPGTGLVGHLSPDTARKLRAALATGVARDRRGPRAPRSARSRQGRGRRTRSAASPRRRRRRPRTAAREHAAVARQVVTRAPRRRDRAQLGVEIGVEIGRPREVPRVHQHVGRERASICRELCPPPGARSRSSTPSASAANSASRSLPTARPDRCGAGWRGRRAGAAAGTRGSRSRARPARRRPTRCTASADPTLGRHRGATREKPAHARRWRSTRSLTSVSVRRGAFLDADEPEAATIAPCEFPLTVNDFLERAELVYGDRVGIVDEPDQPAASWGALHVARGRRAGRAPRPPGSTRSASARASASRSCRRTRPGCSRRSSA